MVPPLLLSILVPALMTNVPVPRAVALLMFNCPADRVIPPSYVPAPFRINVPAPALVKLNVEAPSVIVPPTVRLPALTVIMRFAPSVTVPVPRFRSLVPTNVKSPFQLCVLLFERVIAAPLVLSIDPPLIVNVPVPTAVAVLMSSCPADNVIPPSYVPAPFKIKVPAPALVRLNVDAPSVIVPPTVRLPALTVTIRLAPRVTAPVPKLRSLVPTNVKSPFQL